MTVPADGYFENASLTTANFQAGMEQITDHLRTGGFASNGEVQTGTEAAKFVSPASLRACTATETRIGVVELATTAEVQTGTDTARAVTPAGLAARTATETRAGVVELATTAEAIAGSDTARAVTPAGLSAAMRPTTVAGHVRAGNMQIRNGTAGYTGVGLSVNIDGDAAEDTWVSVGPTGSGASIIWTALDGLPSTARILLGDITISMESTHATAQQPLDVHAAAGGVTPTSTDSSSIAKIYIDNTPVGQAIIQSRQVFIPMSSSRVFQIMWERGGTEAFVGISLRYVGFITD